jgi:hypothetical protein
VLLGSCLGFEWASGAPFVSLMPAASLEAAAASIFTAVGVSTLPVGAA